MPDAQLAPRADRDTFFIQNMWAVSNKEAEFNVIHTHPNALLSGVFCESSPSRMSSSAQYGVAMPCLFGGATPKGNGVLCEWETPSTPIVTTVPRLR